MGMQIGDDPRDQLIGLTPEGEGRKRLGIIRGRALPQLLGRPGGKEFVTMRADPEFDLLVVSELNFELPLAILKRSGHPFLQST